MFIDNNKNPKYLQLPRRACVHVFKIISNNIFYICKTVRASVSAVNKKKCISDANLGISSLELLPCTNPVLVLLNYLLQFLKEHKGLIISDNYNFHIDKPFVDVLH